VLLNHLIRLIQSKFSTFLKGIYFNTLFDGAEAKAIFPHKKNYWSQIFIVFWKRKREEKLLLIC
jgi:hypothetical protein